MKEAIISALLNLIKIKSIVTLACTYVFVKLSLGLDIEPKSFLEVFLFIIGFYFGIQKAKEGVPDPSETVTPAASDDQDEYYES